METQYSYILLIAILALSIAIFQYGYRVKKRSTKHYIFTLLRFLSLFLLGILLLNPKFDQKNQHLVKPSLVVAIDNSNSIQKLEQDKFATQFLSEIKKSKLNQQFDIRYYRFGKQLETLDTLNFSDVQTNISNVFTSLKEVYKNTNAPTILVTDGNQTYGSDYNLSAQVYTQPIYPVVLGDSVLKSDLKIDYVQHNKYAFLKNETPVEVTVSYVGQNAINQNFTVYKGKQKVFQKKISFSTDISTQVIHFTLPTNQIGKQYYSANIQSIPSEENVQNNNRKFNISVIDERTKVLIVSSIIHPDIGTFKKAIESNKQRKVTIVKPTDLFDINDYQLVLAYQPNASFTSVFDSLKKFKMNHLVVTGLQTDWNFLNGISENYKKTILKQKQEYLAQVNTNFNLFQYDALAFENYPPLLDFYGDLTVNSASNVVLYQQIGAVKTAKPLFTLFENGKQRSGLWIGSGIWKWRAKSFIETESFASFDAFMGKTVQFLASNTAKQRLVVDAKDSYYLGEAQIEAQYFDKNYQFDANAQLRMTLKNKTSSKVIHYDFANINTGYVLDLSNLPAGNYQYTVGVLNSTIKQSGTFEVLSFNIEAQFLNADVTKLRQLATNTTNKLYFSTNYKRLFSDLESNKQYKATQKEVVTQKPLIDWKYLLGIILFLLALEWLLRKYNGLL